MSEAEAHVAGAEAEIDGVQGGDGVAIHGDVNGSGRGIVSELHVMPAASGGKRGGAALGADAHALAAIHVKDAVVHGLLVGGVDGEVGIVEVRFIAVRKDDEKRVAERFDIELDGDTAIGGLVRQRELDGAARAGQRSSIMHQTQDGYAILLGDRPI